MVRRYDERVDVREGAAHGPALFLWRGRLYVVRQVLGHWRERRAWWLEGATARLLGLVDEGARREGDSLEREVWRVEAGCGRSAGVGVYDLSRDVLDGLVGLDASGSDGDGSDGPGGRGPASTTSGGPSARWALLQVAD